jgi:uncharacterized protein YsxB (DUF464 family)
MIRVSVRERAGVPVVIEADGHAQRGPDGLSAACAAVSVVLKAVGLELVGSDGCRVTGELDSPGRYRLEVVHCDDRCWLRGVWDLSRGILGEIAREWPREVEFTVIEENTDGT